MASIRSSAPSGANLPPSRETPDGRTWLVRALVLLALFLLCLGLVVGHAVNAADRGLDLDLHTALGSSTFPFFNAVSVAGAGTVRLVLVLLAVGALTIKGYWRYAVLLLGAVTGAALLDGLVKLLVARPRPHLFPGAESAAGYSFPSGHAMNAAAFCAALAFVAIGLVRGRGARVAIVVLATAVAGVVGLARVAIGVHYPSDVVGGWLLGTAWFALCAAVVYWPRPLS